MLANANAVVRAYGPGVVRFTGASANTFAAASVQVDAGTLDLGKTAGVDAIANTVGVINVGSGASLRLDAANQIGNTVNLTLTGGSYNLNGFSETLGTLDLNAASFLTLGGTGTSSASFANSSLLDWGSFSLSVSGTFVDGQSIRFGTDATGLSSGQLASILVNGQSVTIDSAGYLSAAAVPEPSAFAALAGLGALGLVASRRRRSYRFFLPAA